MAELNFNNVMIGSAQPEVLGEFYARIFDRPADMNDGGWYGWQVGAAWLSIGEHSEVKDRANEPERVILNFETKEVKEEFERLKGTGATVVKEPYEMEGMWIATFADPDGNYFQLMSPWEGQAS
ncbi:MAG: VOC family protein [Actinobacteria bacterium]|nr:VOC family protein [Actinomycetota bacterium]